MARRKLEIEFGVAMIPAGSNDKAGDNNDFNRRRIAKARRAIVAATSDEGISLTALHVIGCRDDIETIRGMYERDVPKDKHHLIKLVCVDDDLRTNGVPFRWTPENFIARARRELIHKGIGYTFIATHERNGKKEQYASEFEKRRQLKVLPIPCNGTTIRDLLKSAEADGVRQKGPFAVLAQMTKTTLTSLSFF